MDSNKWYQITLVIVVCVSLFMLIGCSGGAGISQNTPPEKPATTLINIWGLPVTKYDRFFAEALFLDSQNKLLEPPTILPPMDSELVYTYEFKLNPLAEQMVINLYFSEWDLYNSARPEYKCTVELRQPLSEIDFFWWLDNNSVATSKYGISKMLAIPVTNGAYYELELTQAPYYLLSLAGEHDHINEIIITVNSGYADIKYGPDLKNLRWTQKRNGSLSLSNFDKSEFYIHLAPSDYSLSTNVTIEVNGTKQVDILPEPMVLIPTSDPELVYGLSKYNLYLINPVLGEITDWKILPVYFNALEDIFNNRVEKQYYDLIDDVLYAYTNNSYDTTSYFIYDHATGDFTVGELEGRYLLGFAPQHNCFYGAITQERQEYLIRFELDSQVVTGKWPIYNSINMIYPTLKSDQILLLYRSVPSRVYRYRITQDELVCEETATGSILNQRAFNADRTQSYWYRRLTDDKYCISAMNVEQLSQVVDDWDGGTARRWYIDAFDQCLYQIEQTDQRAIVTTINMDTKQEIAKFPLSSIHSTITANADNSVVMEVYENRLIYHVIPHISAEPLVPMSLVNYNDLVHSLGYGWK